MAGPLNAILETALYADDIDAAEAFYGTVLGLEKITRAADRHVFFKVGTGVLLIFNPALTIKLPTNSALPVPPHGAIGPGHACFRMTSAEMDDFSGRLQAAGIEIEADFEWPNGGRSIYFRDPAGNSLECAEARIWGL